jgi:phage terminase small subunit
MKKKDELTPSQARFAEEYVKDLNKTQAAIRAGYSENTAESQGVRLSKNAKVQQYILKLQEKRSHRTEITADKVLKEIFDLATVDITQAFDDMGQMKPLKEIPANVRKAISHLEVAEIFDGQGDQKHAIGLMKKSRFYDRIRALELLMRHLGLLNDKLQITESDRPLKEMSDAELERLRGK